MHDPWLRQPREPRVAFSAFQAFLALGPERTVNKLWDKMKEEGKTGGKGERPMGRLWGWHHIHDWHARAIAHDRHIAQIEQQAVDAARRKRAKETEENRLKLQDAQHVICRTAMAGLGELIRLTTDTARELRGAKPENVEALADRYAYRFQALVGSLERACEQQYKALSPWPQKPDQQAQAPAEQTELDEQLECDWIEFRSKKALEREGLPDPVFEEPPSEN